MITKKDLVKQFELVVKQEVIDHNKAIEASNLALNKQKIFVEEEIKKIKENHRLIINEYSLVTKTFNDTNTSVDKMKSLFKDLSNEQHILNLRNSECIQDVSESVKIAGKKQELLDKRLGSLEELVKLIKKEVKKTDDQFVATEEKTRASLTKATKRLKKEMLDIPSRAEEVKAEVMEELSMYKIDTVGLMKEINVLKKDCYIKDKKIENLYTLIERINKKFNALNTLKDR